MKKIISIVCYFCLLFSACGKEEVKNVISVHPVNFKVDINNQDNVLKTAGGFKTFETPRLKNEQIGFSGLLVVSSPLSEMNNPILYAYDLCCPHEAEKHTKITPHDDGTATCNKCGSVFDIYSGFGKKMSGPSENPLQVYGINAAGNGIFHIVRKN